MTEKTLKFTSKGSGVLRCIPAPPDHPAHSVAPNLNPGRSVTVAVSESGVGVVVPQLALLRVERRKSPLFGQLKRQEPELCTGQGAPAGLLEGAPAGLLAAGSCPC
jgi:hypothetical protein